MALIAHSRETLYASLRNSHSISSIYVTNSNTTHEPTEYERKRERMKISITPQKINSYIKTLKDFSCPGFLLTEFSQKAKKLQSKNDEILEAKGNPMVQLERLFKEYRTYAINNRESADFYSKIIK